MEQQPNINRLTKGLYLDTSPVDQPQETYRFALNAVSETNEGDRGMRANEESNEQCFELPAGYIPLGSVYIGDGDTVIFSVAGDESSSEIGIADDNCNYTTVVNADLGFKINNRIDATYRLRRGCEKNIYFVTPTPMIFNFEKQDDFKTLGAWDPDKFKLFKTYDSIPLFSSIEIEDSGTLPPGSYNASIQYLDNDLNPTEWISTSETIKIYSDNDSKNYPEIRGSSSLVTDYQNFGNTNKSIKFTFSNLDTSYPFFRVAIIGSNNGSGQVNLVGYSAEIPVEVGVFNYTGSESLQTEGTEEEIKQFNNIIDEAEHIEQAENRLLLGNVKGKDIDYCKLQKYASRIKADLTTKTVVLNAISESNPKSGTVDFDGTGYMPGEIYSFGIVYVFADGTLSPVFHIPGKNAATVGTTFVQNPNLLPMSIDNELDDTFYTDNSSCTDYWSVDSEGDALENEKVRHHRFPLRSEVNKPLIESQEGIETLGLEQLVLTITGTIDPTYAASNETIDYAVEYEINGNPTVYEGTINVATYDPLNGLTINIVISADSITVNNIYENGVAVATPSATTDLTYATAIETANLDVEDKVYTSEIFGIHFSGIDLPPSTETGGHEIVGYYIVRNERTEENKTILDTGVIAPLLEEPYFVAHGHIMPNLAVDTRIKEDAFALIHPEHRFGGREYRSTSQLIQEGEFRLDGTPTVSSVLTQDVMPGTSYDPDVSKRREADGDGFTLHTFTRDNEVYYRRVEDTFADTGEIEELFYLDTLNSKVITDTASARKEIFNVSADNKIGIIQTNVAVDKSKVNGRLPYVIMKRELSNPYAGFRVEPYFSDVKNRIAFVPDGMGGLLSGDQTSVFGGDTYITPMRYHSAMFYDIRLRKRASKKGIFNIILGVIAIVAGAVSAVFGGGAASISLAAWGVSQLATGVKKEQVAKVYSELYDAGLRDAVNDDDVDAVFSPNPEDDQVQWMSDTVTNLWFESTANMALRQGATQNLTDFLDAPAVKANGPSSIDTIVYTFPWGGGLGLVISADAPVNELDSYLLEKVTVLDSQNENGRLYQGFANAEIYEINKDYRRFDKQKVHFHLGIEYDCCSSCREEFPQRVHYSQQSFQEELTDNYRTFLPNNYRDIEGEQGTITDLFRIQNNIYIHTQEALWHLPQNIQERITGDVVSFIGTGEFFAIPPRKIVDDEQNSAGTQHKWATIKTKYGVFFISETERKVYLFNGNELKPISDEGLFSWFKNYLPLSVNQQYKDAVTRDYPYLNNPSNKFGAGFISTYDSRKERFIFNKRDFVLSDEVIVSNDFEVCTSGGSMVVFEDFLATIAAQEALGWTFEGVTDDCRLEFSRVDLEEVTEDRNQVSLVPNNLDIHIFYDTSGSFGGAGATVNDIENDLAGDCLKSINDAVEGWLADFAASNPDWTGNVYKYVDNTERWLNYASVISSATYGGVTNDKEVLVISFCNEADTVYHDATLDSPIASPTSDFLDDYDVFTGQNTNGNNPGLTDIYGSYQSFIGIHYPIVFGTSAGSCGTGGGSIPASKNFLLHSIAALYGDTLSAGEADALQVNPAFTTGEWDTLKSDLQTTNPYPNDGLENYGWLIKTDREADASGSVITITEFEDDINEFLEGILEITPIQVVVDQAVTNYQYIDGTAVASPIDYNRSYTMSYSMKDDAWVGWHSYLTNFFYRIQDKFYSWIHDNDFFYIHNVQDGFQVFFGTRYPFIVEYVSKKSPLITGLWDYIKFQTEAKRYDDTLKEWFEVKNITFNKAIFYNSRQNTGLMLLKPKDLDIDPAVGYVVGAAEDYLSEQVVQSSSVIIDRNEKDWTINDFRDFVTDYTVPMFTKEDSSLQSEYFIDKVLNPSSVDASKHWSQLESFRDKYLVLRFIFDNFENIRLVMKYSAEPESRSFR